MKENPQSIKSIFGLKQNEMAMLLGVSLGQYSMFECGRRSLPLQATERLNAMLAHMKGKPEQNKSTEVKSSVKLQKFITQQVSAAGYRQLILENKISAVLNKLESAKKAQHLSRLIEKMNQEDGKYPCFNILNTKRSGADLEEFRLELFRLKLALHLLTAEKKFLEQQLKNGSSV